MRVGPTSCLLTAGQRHDITQAKALIDGLPAEWVLGDTAFAKNLSNTVSVGAEVSAGARIPLTTKS